MSREWPEKVSYYRESHSLIRMATLRHAQTGRGQFSSSADYLLCTSACFVPWPYYLSFLCHCLFCIVTSLWDRMQVLESFTSLGMWQQYPSLCGQPSVHVQREVLPEAHFHIAVPWPPTLVWGEWSFQTYFFPS